MPAKDFHHLSHSEPQSPDAAVRWHSCENTTNEDIPPFACMLLQKPDDLPPLTPATVSDRRHLFAQRQDAGQAVWYVSKCDDEAEALHEPGMFVFNSHRPIRRRIAGKPELCRGLCTQDYPARALTIDSINQRNTSFVGPRSGSWLLHWGGFDNPSFPLTVRDGPYIKISEDATGPIGNDTLSGLGNYSVIWVAPARRFHVPAAVTELGNLSNVADNDYLIPMIGSSVLAPNPHDNSGMSQGNAFEYDDSLPNPGNKFLLVSRSGTYWFSFSCTLYSLSAVRGTGLLLNLWQRKTDGTVFETPYYCYREQNQEEDQYGNIIHTAKENVAMSGPISLQAGEGLAVRNLSGVDVVCLRSLLSLMRITEFDTRLRGLYFGEL